MTYRDWSGYADRGALVGLMPIDVERVRQQTDAILQEAATANRRHRHEWHPDPDMERRKVLIGFLGEAALAKFLRVPHEYATNYDKARSDVAGIEVRSTDHGHGHLITYPDDKAAPTVLAIVHRISFYKFDVMLAGWAWLEDTLRPEFYREPPEVRAPAYFTPQTALHPMATLTQTRKAANL